MSRLPIVDYRTMEKVLVSLGFQITRQKGAHVFFRHLGGRTTTVPNHLENYIFNRTNPRNRSVLIAPAEQERLLNFASCFSDNL